MKTFVAILAGLVLWGAAAFANLIISAAGGGGGNNTAIDGTPVHKNVTSGSSTTLPGLTTASAGDLICVVCTINNTYVTSVTSANVTFSKRVDQLVSNGICSSSPTNSCLSFWSGVASGALAGEIITVTLNASTGFMTCDAFAIQNQAGFDTNVALPTVGNLGSNVPIATISTSNANDMLLGLYRMSTTASPAAGTGWTAISGADYQLVEYQKVTATQTNATAPLGGGASDESAGIGDAVKSN